MYSFVYWPVHITINFCEKDLKTLHLSFTPFSIPTILQHWKNNRFLWTYNSPILILIVIKAHISLNVIELFIWYFEESIYQTLTAEVFINIYASSIPLRAWIPLLFFALYIFPLSIERKNDSQFLSMHAGLEPLTHRNTL